MSVCPKPHSRDMRCCSPPLRPPPGLTGEESILGGMDIRLYEAARISAGTCIGGLYEGGERVAIVLGLLRGSIAGHQRRQTFLGESKEHPKNSSMS